MIHRYAFDVTSCQQAYIDGSGCTGIDFCSIEILYYLIFAASTGKLIGGAIGVAHYEINRLYRKQIYLYIFFLC